MDDIIVETWRATSLFFPSHVSFSQANLFSSINVSIFSSRIPISLLGKKSHFAVNYEASSKRPSIRPKDRTEAFQYK